MYSASYEQNEQIPVKNFTDPILKEEFVKMINTKPKSQQPQQPQLQPQQAVQDNEQQNVPVFSEAQHKQYPNSMDYHKKDRSVGHFLDGFLKNIELEDIILAGLIFLFLKDDNKDNDIMIPVLLFILLAF